ncbi:MAG TPA: hypothetical protein VFA12_20600 [Stellaceae bacterium]|nr:hypothetical protein [Stellaceae bacterium]
MSERQPNYKRLFGEAVSESIRDHTAERAHDLIKPGFYLVRLVKMGPLLPAKVEACNTEPGEPENVLDRGRPYFVAEIAGEAVDPLDVFCATDRREIGEAEFLYQSADLAWAREHAPQEAKAGHPRRRVDLNQAAPLYPPAKG